MIAITGASAGIGFACATAFAREKHPLLLIARRHERLTEMAKTLRTEFGIDVHTVALDVSDKDQVTTFLREEERLLKQVSVLVNNAGLSKGLETLQEGSWDDWDITIDTNIKGLLYMTRGVLPFFLANRKGHIINIGSVAGHWAYPKGNVYCATKSAVHMLSEAMRLDLNGSGIRVTEISPGMVKTEFSLVRFKGDEQRADAVYAGMTPLTPEDVAEAVIWSFKQPARVNIQEIVLYPTDQASPTVVSRKT